MRRRPLIGVTTQTLHAIEGIPEGWRLLIIGRAELGSRTVFSFIPTHVTTPWVESNKFRPRPPA